MTLETTKRFISQLDDYLEMHRINKFHMELEGSNKKEPPMELTIMVESPGGSYTAMQAIVYILKKFMAEVRPNITFILLNECSSAAAEFVFEFKDRAKVLVSTVCQCILHKLVIAGEMPRDKKLYKQLTDIDKKATADTIAKYKSSLTASQLRQIKNGGEVSLTHREILTFFKGKSLS